MTDAQLARTIFNKWKASLSERDRSKKNVKVNFDDLWYELWAASIPYDIAELYLKEASAAHMPNHYMAQRTYKNLKTLTFGQSFKEWIDDWKSDITDKCNNAFYERFPIEELENREPPKPVADEAPIGMDKAEYKRQRRYIEQFPVIDLKKARKKMEEIERQMEENEDGSFDPIDLEELLYDETK